MSSNNDATAKRNHNSGGGGESVPNLNSCGGNPVGHRPNLGPYFLDLARLSSARSSLTSFSSSAVCEAAREDEEEPAPTEIDTINSSGGFLVVSTDKLSIKYTNVNLHGHDVGVIQGNRPAPTKRLVYYFEIYVKDAGAKGQIGVGISRCGNPDISEFLPFSCGKPTAVAIMVTMGFFIVDKVKAKLLDRPIRPAMLLERMIQGIRDTPARAARLYRESSKLALIPIDTRNSGYTIPKASLNGGTALLPYILYIESKNKVLVGTVFKDMKAPLFPTAAVHSQNEEVHVNFGQKPFAFDIKVFEAQERMKVQTTIKKNSLPPNISYGVVRSYLLHCGYEETLNSFEMANKSTIPPISFDQENGYDEQDILYALCQRKTLRQLIEKGEADAAFSKLQEWYPQVVEDDKSAVCLLLRCQKFIELVRVGALEELSKFFGMVGFEYLVQVPRIRLTKVCHCV